MWHHLNDDQKVPFMVEANRLRDEHKAANPGYRYQPKRRSKLTVSSDESNVKIRSKLTVSSDESNVKIINGSINKIKKKRLIPKAPSTKHLNGKPIRRVDNQNVDTGLSNDEIATNNSTSVKKFELEICEISQDNSRFN